MYHYHHLSTGPFRFNNDFKRERRGETKEEDGAIEKDDYTVQIVLAFSKTRYIQIVFDHFQKFKPT